MKKIIGFVSVIAIVAFAIVLIMKNGAFAKNDIAISVSESVEVGGNIDILIQIPENITSYSGGEIHFYNASSGNEEVLAPISIANDGIDEPLSVREITKTAIAPSKEGTVYVEVRFNRINENTPYTSNRIPVKVVKSTQK